MIEFQLVSDNEAELNKFYQIKKKTLYTTKEWIQYLKNYTKAELCVIKIIYDKNHIGYFSGFTFRVSGIIKVFASPFPGWITPYMGFDFYEDDIPISRCEIINEMLAFISHKIKAHIIRICDRYISLTEAKLYENKYIIESTYKTIMLDLTRSEDEIYRGFSQKSCRYCINKFNRAGGRIIEDYSNEFISVHYDQLKHVFSKHGLVPTYPEKRIQEIYKALEPSGMIISAKALSPEGENIASSYFTGNSAMCFFGSNASFQGCQRFCPNEALQWYLIRKWKEKGAGWCDLGGYAEYKRKFGGELTEIPVLVYSKAGLLVSCMRLAKRLYYFSTGIPMKLKKIIHRNA